MQSAATARWDVDSDGRAIYRPFGSAYTGYRLADTVAEQNVRLADEDYSKRTSKVGRPLGQIIGTLVAGYLILAFSRHPVLSLAGCYALLVIAVYLEGVLRYSSVRESLREAEAVPPKPQARRRLLVASGIALAFLAAFWAALSAYDLEVSTLASRHPGETWLFPSIAGKLVFFVMLFFVVFSACARFDVFSARLGQNKAVLALVVCAVIDVGLAVWIIAKVVAPAPSVIVSDQSIRCGWSYSYLWREVSGLQQKSSKYSTYAVMTLRPSIARSLGKATDRCEIDGLTVDDDTVYRMIVAAWQPHANGS